MSAEIMEYGPDERTSIKQSFSQELRGGSPEPDKSYFCKPIPKRYILAFMAFFGFCNAYIMRVNLSVAVVAMVNNYTILVNGTKSTVVDFDWSHPTQGILLGAFFWGYAITQLPGGWLSSKIGGKNLYGAGIMCTGTLSILTPLGAKIGGLPLLIIIRILEGFCEGVTYPCMHTLWSKWAPPLERSKLSTISVSGSYVGTMLSLPLSGLIAEYLGWPSIFYISGSCAVIWYVFWCWLIAESPADHTTITNHELEYITGTIGFSYIQFKGVPTPWKAIFKSLPFWAITVSHFVENWGFYTLLTELPTFLNDIMNYSLYQIGSVAGLPYLAMSITVLLGGQLADCLRARNWFTTTNVRKLFNCTAFIGQTIFMMLTAYMMTPVAAVTCLTFAVGIGGFAWSGFSVNMLDIAPQYAGIMMGMSNTVASIPGIMAPAIAGHMVQHKTVTEWRSVFYLASGIYLIGAIFYGIFASGKLQPWADYTVTKPSFVEEVRPSQSADVIEYESGHDELK